VENATGRFQSTTTNGKVDLYKENSKYTFVENKSSSRSEKTGNKQSYASSHTLREGSGSRTVRQSPAGTSGARLTSERETAHVTRTDTQGTRESKALGVFKSSTSKVVVTKSTDSTVRHNMPVNEDLAGRTTAASVSHKHGGFAVTKSELKSQSVVDTVVDSNPLFSRISESTQLKVKDQVLASTKPVVTFKPSEHVIAGGMSAAGDILSNVLSGKNNKISTKSIVKHAGTAAAQSFVSELAQDNVAPLFANAAAGAVVSDVAVGAVFDLLHGQDSKVMENVAMKAGGAILSAALSTGVPVTLSNSRTVVEKGLFGKGKLFM
jgi:hypothetical protein